MLDVRDGIFGNQHLLLFIFWLGPLDYVLYLGLDLSGLNEILPTD